MNFSLANFIPRLYTFKVNESISRSRCDLDVMHNNAKCKNNLSLVLFLWNMQLLYISKLKERALVSAINRDPYSQLSGRPRRQKRRTDE